MNPKDQQPKSEEAYVFKVQVTVDPTGHVDIKDITWRCTRCNRYYYDADETKHPGNLDGFAGYEPKEYWLSSTEPICAGCAQELHIA